MTTITAERLEAVRRYAESDGKAWHPKTVIALLDHIDQLTARAEAAEAEIKRRDALPPVLEITHFGKTTLCNWIQPTKRLPDGTKLFTAAPAPVAPPEIEPTIQAIRKVIPTANPDEYACCVGADMWNACRAAMLKGGAE